MGDPYLEPQNPLRISERRGKPELQPLVPILPSRISTNFGITMEADVDSSYSPTFGGEFSPENYATPAMSTPATPTDVMPTRSFASPFATTSSIVGSSIREEEETTSNCDCQDCEDVIKQYGLGLAVGSMGTKDVAFPRLDMVRPIVREGFEDPCYGTHYHFNEKLAPVALPPTPPEHAELPFGLSGQVSPTSPAIDAEAFSTPPSLPQSPKSETSRSRAATILTKVVPSKLRASLKRRMSGANESSNLPPAIPAITTMPNFASASAPVTPPEDKFGDYLIRSPTSAPATDNHSSTLSSPEAILPPVMVHPLSRTNSVDADTHVYSPRSPRAVGILPFIRTDGLPETPRSASSGELMNSPLHPPTVSPLTSSSVASTSQTSLSTPNVTLPYAHKKVPSIDPATSSAPKKPAPRLTNITADLLADMIEEMHRDLAAYDATHSRMIESGWSSPREIRNVELQREEHHRSWERRISESKKVLETMRRIEVKDIAMSSVCSFDSAWCGASGAQLTSTTSLPDGDRNLQNS